MNIKLDMRNFQAKDFGKVVVLMGGKSTEYEVSIQSGNAILTACKSLGLDVEGVVTKEQPIADITRLSPQWVFNIVHGGYGENGQLAAVLELMHIGHCSTHSQSMMLAMSKTISKTLWRSAGLRTPDWVSFGKQTLLTQAIEIINQAGLHLPLVVKPADEGSSFGLYLAYDDTGLYQALDQSLAINRETLVETCIEGDEMTVGIIGDTILPPILVIPDGGIYDYRAKYLSNDTRMMIPTGLAKDIELAAQHLAQRAFACLGCSVWGRIDLMRDRQSGELYVIEINTLPGMTDHSLVPRAAQSLGITFPQLVAEIFHQSRLAPHNAHQNHFNKFHRQCGE